jgi:hypothetical protein
MTPDERRHALAFNAVGPAVNEAGCWLPLSARKTVAEAVLKALDAEPVERCGDLVNGPTGGWLECVLRPGHHGSHANEDDTRWTMKPAAGYCPHCGRGDAGPTAEDYEASQRRAVDFQIRIDAARDWARKNLGAEQQQELLAALRGDQLTA